MRWRECVDRGLIRADPGALERIPGSLASAARFLRAAEKNVAIEEYEMAHPTTVRFIVSGRFSMLEATSSGATPVSLPQYGIHPVMTLRLPIS